MNRETEGSHHRLDSSMRDLYNSAKISSVHVINSGIGDEVFNLKGNVGCTDSCCLPGNIRGLTNCNKICTVVGIVG